MGFKWKCSCGEEHWYSGSKTTDAITTCSACNTKSRIFNRKIVVSTTDKPPKLPKKPQLFNFNGSLESLLIMSNYAINTIKNKKQVKEKDLNSTWYQHYLSWSKWRETFQMALEERR